MRRVVALACAGAFVLAGHGALAQGKPEARPEAKPDAKLEKPRIALSVGGSVSQMNKVAYFVALNRKYFDQEGLTVDSTAFASGTAALQNLIADTEGISQDQVASQILALQNSLQASYQTTSMLSQLSLVKFLPIA